MMGLVLWAAVCALAAALFVALPLLRPGRTYGSAEPLLAAVTATLVVATAGISYPLLSHGSWRRSTGDSPISVAALLAATDEHPDDVQAWLNLGRAYLGIQQWPLARRSFQHADRLSNGSNAAALSGLGQTLIFENNGTETEASTALFNRALQLDPHSPQALFYTGVALLHAGDLASARERFAAMRELGPPPQIMAALDRQIGAIDEEIKRLKPDPATTIHLRVTLAPALAAKVAAGSSLFVFVRAPHGGPPLAVKRLPASFPQQVDLSATDSMLAGNRITPGQRVQVMARVSARGAPVAGPGDLVGEVGAVAGGAGMHDVAIDRQSP
jgi:cytochrome c-type biogenesis protein CcmH